MEQDKSYLISKDVAVFYPRNFDEQSHMPSLALLQEPSFYSKLPNDWQSHVEFYETSGRSHAKINVGENVDLYGTGEVTGKLKRNGTVRTLYNLDNFHYSKFNGSRLYQSHPWVMGVRKDGSAFGVLADNTWRMEISCGRDITFSAESKPFRVFIIEKDSPQEVLMQLAELTGKMSLPPLWSLGFHQCRWSYFPDKRVKEIADTFRSKKIPCDVIWMDIHYMDKYKIFTFDPEHFPNPEETNAYLHKNKFKAVWMIDPGIKKEKGYKIYDSGTKNGLWVKTRKNKNYAGEVWPGPCVFPDFTQDKAQAWWSALYKDFMARGIDGVWNDMNEPAVFDDDSLTMPDDNMHKGGKCLPKDVHLRYHNVYGMLMVKASRKGIEAANPDKRPFILTRSNFLGGHRYAATWTGDNKSCWEQLKMSIPMSINLGLSGQAFSGPDIGGFEGNARPELFGHWIALGTFYPFSRAHTIEGSKGHEPWAFGNEIELVSRQAIERRYRLLPYLYTQFYDSSRTGIPIMQPAFFADVKDLNLRSEEEAFLFGPDLYIIPRWAKDVQEPKGEWKTITILKNEKIKDNYLPEVKLRPGAILPLSDVIQSTVDYSLYNLELHVMLNSSGYAEGKLYHDAGEGFDNLRGDYFYLSIIAQKTKGEIIVQIKDQAGNAKLVNKLTIVQIYDGAKIYTDKGILSDGITVKTENKTNYLF